MDPEFVTSQHSSHARVDCVACHVGSGATAYVKTKISGMRQLYHVVRNDFPRPIRLDPDDPRKLRPARETCEQCHWPQKFTGGFERTYRHFLSDEKNTPFTVRLLLNVGGGDPHRGQVGGIHWHVNPANKVEYVSPDEQQRVIPMVRFTDPNGVVTEYRTADFKGDLSKLPMHTMDCIDCHSRPSHNFLSPNAAVDISLASGLLDPKLPWVKAKVVDALVQPYSTHAEALQKIAASLRTAYPNNPETDATIAEAQSIYRNNFFPEMHADWRSYPDHIGHKEWDGCFRWTAVSAATMANTGPPTVSPPSRPTIANPAILSSPRAAAPISRNSTRTAISSFTLTPRCPTSPAPSATPAPGSKNRPYLVNPEPVV
jgi:hypothetical protein